MWLKAICLCAALCAIGMSHVLGQSDQTTTLVVLYTGNTNGQMEACD